MQWLNYHHFLYFWVVAKEGSIAAASQKLHLAQPTISAQIHRLEEQLGEKLFERKGRQLVLTDFGTVALGYAEEIFALGREFVETARGRSTGRPLRLVVGVSNTLPKSIVRRMLEPALQLEQSLRLVVREDRSIEAFLGELTMHTVDLVLSDAPADAGGSVRVLSHVLGECGTAFFAAKNLVARRKDFPTSLDGAPFLLPRAGSAPRRALDVWFDALGVRPKIVAEVEDPALAKVLAEAGLGIVAAPEWLVDELRRRYQLRCIGRAPDLWQRFYALSLERKVKHPAIAAICAVG